jgi:hypothetical protein
MTTEIDLDYLSSPETVAALNVALAPFVVMSVHAARCDVSGALVWHQEQEHEVWGARVRLFVDLSADKREGGRGTAYVDVRISNALVSDQPAAVPILARMAEKQCERILARGVEP